MRNVGITLVVLSMVGTAAWMAYRLRHYRASARHAIAGGLATLSLGALLLIMQSGLAGLARTVIMVALFAAFVLFFGAEIIFWRSDRFELGENRPQ